MSPQCGPTRQMESDRKMPAEEYIEDTSDIRQYDLKMTVEQLESLVEVIREGRTVRLPAYNDLDVYIEIGPWS